MFKLEAVPRPRMLLVVPIMIAVAAACGGSADTTVYDQPVSARVVVTDVQVSPDETRVESITVLTDDGEEITMKLGAEIEPLAWGPPHLLSHAGLGKSLGLKIEVTYVRTGDSVTVIKLSE